MRLLASDVLGVVVAEVFVFANQIFRLDFILNEVRAGRVLERSYASLDLHEKLTQVFLFTFKLAHSLLEKVLLLLELGLLHLVCLDLFFTQAQ